MVKKICGILSTLILIVLAVLGALIIIPMIMGMKEMAVLSGSMEPNVPVGSLCYIDDDYDVTKIEKDDIVTYRLDQSSFVTHRVVSVDTDGRTFVTKGDNNNSDDGNITFERFYGKVKFHIPFIGYISMYVKTRIGILAIVFVIALVVFLNFLPALFEPDEKTLEKKKEN